MRISNFIKAGFISATGFFIITFFYCKQSDKDAGIPEIPEARIEGKIDGDLVRISVRIPEQHHAYLDKGKDGRLIPISFDWENTADQPAAPKLQSIPKGNFDDIVEATVLRGDGEFVFEVKKASGFAGKVIKVKSQICNEVKGVCYRPKIENVVLN